MPSPTEITSAQLARLSGTPEAPVLIDLRIDADFDDDPRLIPAAFRHDFTDIEALAPALYGRGVVVYCQKGCKISQGRSPCCGATASRRKASKAVSSPGATPVCRWFRPPPFPRSDRMAAAFW